MTPGEDNGTRVLRLIDEHLDSIRDRLTDEQYDLLLTRLRALADTPAGDARAARRAFQAVRLSLVPLPFDHPVREALDSVRLVATAPVGDRVVLRTRDLLARLAATPAPPDTAAIIAAVEDRLLHAPALSAAEVRTRYRGAAPPPELIRLTDPELGDRYPEFQFAPGGGAPYDVVLEVNRVLLADADPWGAADWWLSGNPWLGGGPPAALLGIRPDRDLVGAAVALVEGA
ncbi:hypothetical protein [Streptomyces flavofungini]|uniref:Anti-sigma factor n=1 Tax=Streptomyces flavofungini TaxID=68200 RepID=A0ABS0X9E6_9ACTN|nr:hypothetical protein [Streptomyces flavofungini]MBJ3809833.1 hypothetical protein [Streptomyces flavofungini]GHC81050.1 hypothetical protein GCM10010349_63940 [Streptomyces flavofungini]